ncbi:ester cyclase [Pararhodobacter zhoushanensis]|uniref:ester cyclase n=1 Tax=Pararhodobacter zhoushanensis TaxID=2479545 RepID=UPI003873A8A2
MGDVAHGEVEHNGRRLGLGGYRSMLEGDFRAIPDLCFGVSQMVSEPPPIAARLHFESRLAGGLFGLPVHGKRVQFEESVFHTLAHGRLRWVGPVINEAAIAARRAEYCGQDYGRRVQSSPVTQSQKAATDFRRR